MWRWLVKDLKPIRMPDAEDAEVTQRLRKERKKEKDRASQTNLKFILRWFIDSENVFGFYFEFLFCVFCVTFASSASGYSDVRIYIWFFGEAL